MTAEVVDFLVDDRTWRQEIETRLAKTLDETLLAALKHKTGRGPACHELAELAAQLDEVGDTVRDAIAGAVFGEDSVEKVIARRLLDQLPMPFGDELSRVARALRLLGVWLCALLGRDLARCPCLLALTQDARQEVAAKFIDAQLVRAGR